MKILFIIGIIGLILVIVVSGCVTVKNTNNVQKDSSNEQTEADNTEIALK